MANKVLLKTVEKLTNDEIEDINDFLISNGKGIMNTKDRKAMLEYWLKIAKENEQFFNFLEDLFTRIDEPFAAAVLSQVVNKRIVYSVDTSKKGFHLREYSEDQYIYICKLCYLIGQTCNVILYSIYNKYNGSYNGFSLLV